MFSEADFLFLKYCVSQPPAPLTKVPYGLDYDFQGHSAFTSLSISIFVLSTPNDTSGTASVCLHGMFINSEHMK